MILLQTEMNTHVRTLVPYQPFCFCLQGANASQLEKEIGSDQFPANEHYFGLVNVSDVLLTILYGINWR